MNVAQADARRNECVLCMRHGVSALIVSALRAGGASPEFVQAHTDLCACFTALAQAERPLIELGALEELNPLDVLAACAAVPRPMFEQGK